MVTPSGTRAGGITPGGGLPASVKRVLVLGGSRSGTSAAIAVAGLGRQVLLSDRRAAADLPGLRAVLEAGAAYVLEDSLATAWPQPDLVIKSPGVPAESAPVVLAEKWGVPVWSELELAYAL